MHLLHRSPAPSMPARMLQAAAAGAGTVRLALKQRSLHPRRLRRGRAGIAKRVMHRS